MAKSVRFERRFVGGCTIQFLNGKRREVSGAVGEIDRKFDLSGRNFRKLFCWEGSILCFTGKATGTGPIIQNFENKNL